MSNLTDWMDKCHKLEAEIERRDAFDRASISRIELLEKEITRLKEVGPALATTWSRIRHRWINKHGGLVLSASQTDLLFKKLEEEIINPPTP